MKKILAVFVVLIMLCSCAKAEIEEPENYLPENTENDSWGVTLSLRNITESGATVVFTQSGGNPTGELMTGSYYRLEYANEDLAFVIDDEIAWTAEAYMIPMGGELEMEVKWEWLYGKLPAGTYKIYKSVMDFRGPGDYDNKEYYAEFTVE